VCVCVPKWCVCVCKCVCVLMNCVCVCVLSGCVYVCSRGVCVCVIKLCDNFAGLMVVIFWVRCVSGVDVDCVVVCVSQSHSALMCDGGAGGWCGCDGGGGGWWWWCY
jgi:hypothetical protein